MPPETLLPDAGAAPADRAGRSLPSPGPGSSASSGDRRWRMPDLLRADPVPSSRRNLELGTIVFGWITWGLSYGYASYVLSQIRPRMLQHAGWISGQATAGAAATFLLFAVLRRLCARYPRIGPRLLGAAVLTFAASYMQTFLVIVVARATSGMRPWLLPARFYFPDTLSAYVPFLPFAVLFLWMTSWMELRAERERALGADSIAHEARLQMLRFQLNPHFLFNALGTIRGVIHEDAVLADRLVSELTEFLRYTLQHEERLEVTVGEELDVIQHYLNIQQTRFEAKLSVTLEADAAAREWVIPAFLLHPLVENAIKHGMRTSALPLRVAVRARVVDGELCVDVENSGRLQPAGAGRDGASVAQTAPAEGQTRTGMGLKNVRLQLQHHFPERHAFSIEERAGVVRATLRIGPAHVHTT